MADQLPLPLPELPGTDARCPKCHGTGHVSYLHASRPDVEIIGGKRVACPVCTGAGTIRAPRRVISTSMLALEVPGKA